MQYLDILKQYHDIDIMLQNPVKYYGIAFHHQDDM